MPLLKTLLSFLGLKLIGVYACVMLLILIFSRNLVFTNWSGSFKFPHFYLINELMFDLIYKWANSLSENKYLSIFKMWQMIALS